MIGSVTYCLLYLTCGILSVRWLLPRHRALNRIWLGLSLGLLEEMWLPALAAFVGRFTPMAHAAAAGGLLLLTGGCYLARDRRPARPWDAEESRLLRQALMTAGPLTILGVYLQITHVMRPDAAGNWHVGQSTYGDLPMHMSFITGLAGKHFPADYPFFPGVRLAYPFLTDTLSGSFYVLGAPLQAAVILPASLMMALCYLGVLILGREMTAGKRTMILAALLFFLNGGLGFLYDFDLAGGIGESGQLKIVERIRHILTGYYKTPTNQPDPNNLRWSNVICDMMVPQRTLLGGWSQVIPCLYLLYTQFRAKDRGEAGTGRGRVLLGVWAGLLPLVHTHSFAALGLASVGQMTYDLIHGDPRAICPRRPRRILMGDYLLYGLTAAALAVPQLLRFTFGQALGGEEGRFLAFQFNWVNNPSGRGMRDLYLWFYIKNIGLPFLALLPALLDAKPRRRRIFAAALPIILAAELIRFQPNEYDNNKLFYLAWLLCCMIVADWTAEIWGRLKGLRGRTALAAMTAAAVFLSAGLTVWRECVSDYTAFSAEAVEAGTFARDKTREDAVFLTGTQHLNPVLSIGGRTVVCGPDLWLYWHGIDTWERKADLQAFYEDPAENTDVLDRYGAEYIYVSSYERSDYDVDEGALAEMFPLVFENGEASIYRCTENRRPGGDPQAEDEEDEDDPEDEEDEDDPEDGGPANEEQEEG